MERRRANGFALFVLLGLAALFFLQDGVTGRDAPDFSLRDAYGGRLELRSCRGRPVLLVFWAAYCGICRHQLPVLDRLASEFRGKGVEVIAINVGDLDGAREFMRSNHLGLTSLVDADGAVAQAYKVNGVPKLVLVGRDGKIKRAAVGMRSESAVRRWLESVLTG